MRKIAGLGVLFVFIGCATISTSDGEIFLLDGYSFEYSGNYYHNNDLNIEAYVYMQDKGGSEIYPIVVLFKNNTDRVISVSDFRFMHGTSRRIVDNNIMINRYNAKIDLLIPPNSFIEQELYILDVGRSYWDEINNREQSSFLLVYNDNSLEIPLRKYDYINEYCKSKGYNNYKKTYTDSEGYLFLLKRDKVNMYNWLYQQLIKDFGVFSLFNYDIRDVELKNNKNRLYIKGNIYN